MVSEFFESESSVILYMLFSVYFVLMGNVFGSYPFYSESFKHIYIN
jgi:hypothetical protein